MSTKTQLLLQKLFIAFVVGFFGALVTTLEGLSKEPTMSWDRSVWISLVVGAIAAGVRAVLALGPINLVPSDAQHTIGQKGG